MKRILLHANDDAGFESRFKAAVSLAKCFDARLLCTQITPFETFIMSDPLGGIYALPAVAQRLGEEEEEQHVRVANRVRSAGVAWNWTHFDGHPAHVLLQQSRLADLIVVSLPSTGENSRQLSLAADLAIHARAPVAAVPSGGAAFDTGGTAVVAWDGSAESAHAMRLALPMLRHARDVHLLTIAGKRVELGLDDAADYLKDQGISAAKHERVIEGLDTAEALLRGAAELGASYLVCGAYGHSRLREAVLGGTTRALLSRSDIPLLLAH